MVLIVLFVVIIGCENSFTTAITAHTHQELHYTYMLYVKFLSCKTSLRFTPEYLITFLKEHSTKCTHGDQFASHVSFTQPVSVNMATKEQMLDPYQE